MSMASDYCKASINLDKINSKSQWGKTPNLSEAQQELYFKQEIKTRNKILKRFPHIFTTEILLPWNVCQCGIVNWRT